MQELHSEYSCGFDELIFSLKEENWPVSEDGTKIKLIASPYCAALLSKIGDDCDHIVCF